MDLRRGLLLFAVVLGLAAVATSVSGPSARKDKAEGPPSAGATHSASPRAESREAAALIFSTLGTPRTERLEAGRPAAVTVQVARPGQVELAGLGLSGTADPLTPARFDVFERRAGSYDVRFTSARSGEAQTVGKLRIVGEPRAGG